jgi:two-component system cell cycle response regulator
MSARADIDETMARLRAQVEAAVREEQLRDQLTSLPNDDALTEAITSLLDQSLVEFWIAFVEIDRFKKVNDEFGYDAADDLLKSVAGHLGTAQTYFADGARAFRAHGDEFFLLGRLPDKEESQVIAEALDQVRASIASIRLRVARSPRPMACTVSVGWVTSEGAKALPAPGGLTPRHLRGLLERAVGVAKRQGRNQVVRFTADLEKLATFSHRDDCGTCQASFSVDIPATDLRTDHIRCPNCGSDLPRPIRPAGPPATSRV